jgi:hypothetical protein
MQDIITHSGKFMSTLGEGEVDAHCDNPFLLARQSPNNETKIEQDPSRPPIQTPTQLLKSMS